METGFNRLWNRQRTKTAPSRPAQRPTFQFQRTPTYEVHISGPSPPDDSLPSKPYQNRNPNGQVGNGKIQTGGLQASKERGGQVKDSHLTPLRKVQPVLVGISRPTTASSLHKAVSQAADDVVNGHQPANQKTTPPTQPRSKAAKTNHVDIFQIVAQTRLIGNEYNEDVAVRNLDLRHVPLAVLTNSYNPLSKYQEEVADRNASIERARPDIAAKSSPPRNTDPSDVAGSMYNNPPQQGHVQSNGDHHPGVETSDKKALSREFAPRPAPRMYSMNSKTLGLLPSIPQEIQPESAEIASHVQDNRSTAKRRKSTGGKSAREKDAEERLIRPGAHLKAAIPKSSPSRSPIPNLVAKANVSRPLLTIPNRGLSDASTRTQQSLSSIPDYRLSVTEVSSPAVHTERSHSQPRSNRENSYMGGMSLSDHNIRPKAVRSFSSASRASTLKKAVEMSNRTIMDLTGNDSEIFADEDPVEAHMSSPDSRQASYSPIYAGHRSLGATPNDLNQRIEQTFEGKRSSRAGPPGYFDLPKLDEPSRPSASRAPAISFSKISTVVSLSPRGSVVAVNGSLPSSDDASAAHAKGNLLSQNIYASPESLKSNDFLYPADAFAVLARDFAATSAGKTSTQNGNATSADRPISRKKRVGFALSPLEAAPGPKVARYTTQTTKRTSATRFPDQASAVDDTDFTRKQTQAKAALLRLQRSLEDGFDQPYQTGLTAPTRPGLSRYDSEPPPIIRASPNVSSSIDTPHQHEGQIFPDLPEVRPLYPRAATIAAPSSPSYHAMVTCPSPPVSVPNSPNGTEISYWSLGEAASTHEPEGEWSTGMTPIRPVFDFQSLSPRPSRGELSQALNSRQNSMQKPQVPPLSPKRRNSARSLSSSGSAYSIPPHMVPLRRSSMKGGEDAEAGWVDI